VTTEATANSNSTSIYAIAAVQAAESTTTGAARSETLTQTFPITNNAIYAANTQLTTNEGFAINVAGLSKSFMIGDVYGSAANGSTVQTVADMIAFINADTSWSATGVSITVSNDGFMRSLQELVYTDDLGAAQAVSANGNIWYKLGSTTASGAIAVTAGEVAADIASVIATTIEAHTYHGASLYNATGNGAVIELTQAVSVSGYASDYTSAASIPTITFVIDAAQTSTTAQLGEGDAEDINTYSGSVANATVSNAAIQGGTNGFNISVDTHEVQGITFKLVNTSTTVARLAGDRVTLLPVATSATIGHPSIGGVSQNLDALGLANAGDVTVAVSATLVSGTHFLTSDANGVNNYATTFAQIASTTTTTDQIAAITDRTGWL